MINKKEVADRLGMWPKDVVITSDGRVNLLDDVEFHEDDLAKKLPFQFYKTKDFCYASNKLANLFGCPEIVIGDFAVWSTSITSLQYFPKKVSGIIDLTNLFMDNPYDYRFVLTCHATKIKAPEFVQDILQKYLNKPDLLHVAFSELMDVGESLGFEYDNS